MMKFDVAIVGAGSMGMAAGYFLARQGKNVVLIDAFDPPHHNASHHGETRIIRYAYGEGEQYVPLALRAKALWDELEQESGQRLFLETGVLNIGARDSSFINMLIASAEKHQLPIEILDSEQVRKRYPGVTIPDHFIACLESSSGVLKCEDAIGAYKTLAIKQGATLLCHHPVSHISLSNNQVTLEAKDKTIQAAKLIVCAGAWSEKLLKKMDLELPLTAIRKTFAWFDADSALYGEGVLPAFTFNTPEAIHYGFPSIDNAGLKLGRHDGPQQRQDPEQPISSFSREHDSPDLTRFLQSYLPQVGSLKVGKTCMYTMTPDENFIIDTHPTHSHVVIAAGFSGHGFKFSSVVGEILGELALTGTSRHNISPFSLSRFA